MSGIWQSSPWITTSCALLTSPTRLIRARNVFTKELHKSYKCHHSTETNLPRLDHYPVLLNKTMHSLRLDGKPSESPQIFVDATFGAGGHTTGILTRIKTHSKVYALDRDTLHTKAHVKRLEQAFGNRFCYIPGRFGNIVRLLQDRGVRPGTVDGILFDVGVSSMQLDASSRGFSFMHKGPLDMRMDPDTDITAADLVNNLTQAQIVSVLVKLGNEPLTMAKRIARFIVDSREKAPIVDTHQLSNLIKLAYSSDRELLQKKKLHPATKTFQALRILVNNELQELCDGLDGALQMLRPGGRLVVLCFHSLESTVLQKFFAKCSQEDKSLEANAQPLLDVLTSTVRPSAAEKEFNPRCRSATLRTAVRTAAPYRKVMPNVEDVL